MGRQETDAAFSVFVVTQGARLLHLAELLTADPRAAEDLCQHALAAAYSRWDRIHDPYAYVRRSMTNARTDEWRRGFWRERSHSEIPDRAGDDDVAGDHERRDQVLRLLRKLTARERRVVVLRFYADLTEPQIAQELGIRVGTVKSTLSRALARLRSNLADTTVQFGPTAQPSTTAQFGTPVRFGTAAQEMTS
jgi:RNA polymerase sigma-70 factor (sigma-E family)